MPIGGSVIFADSVADAGELSINAAAERRLEVLFEVGTMLFDDTLATDAVVRRVLNAMPALLPGIWIASFDIMGQRIVIVDPPQAGVVDRVLAGACETHGTVASKHTWSGDAPQYVLRSNLCFGRAGSHVLAVVSAPGIAPFDASDVNFFNEVALRITVALRDGLARDRERRMARVLQSAMLPVALPRPAGITFDAVYRSSETDMLRGGDWYDAFELYDGRVAVSIGDVSGQGLEAAVVMGFVRDAMRAAAMQGMTPGEVLDETNRAVNAAGYGVVAAFVGYLDPFTLALEYASAGHQPPIVVRENREIDELTCGDIVLGAQEDVSYRTRTHNVEEGGAVVFFTDGLVGHASEAVPGEDTLREVLTEWARGGFQASAADVTDRTLAGVRVRDDVVVLVLRTIAMSHVDAHLPGSLRNAQRARSAIGRMLSRSTLGERAADFMLAMGEAINNAIEHGSQSEHDTIRFSAQWDESGGATGMVESRGTWKIRSPSPERGRGLMLMRALTDRLTVNTGPRGTTVRLFLDPATEEASAART